MRTNIISNNVFQSFYKNREYLEEKVKASPNKKEEGKTPKKLIALTAFTCAILPVVALNIKKGRGAELVDTFKSSVSNNKDKLKSVWKLFEIDEFPEILGSTAGAVTGGTLIGSLSAKNKDDKKAKYKEGIFEFLNNMTPTAMVAGFQMFSKKTGKLNSPLGKAFTIATSVAGGMFIANKASNKINEKVFDTKKDEKRNFKITDCLVHLDDIVSLLVIAKVPFAKSIQLDKLLPVLYAKTGYEAGVAKDNPNEGHHH